MKWHPAHQMWSSSSERNGTPTVIYNVTELRVDSNYVYYYIHWTRWKSVPKKGKKTCHKKCPQNKFQKLEDALELLTYLS